ncbi:hypothetical protein HW35_08480 [Bacillus sp. X1(2014)]|jgi:hypothetical protein|nr:hypothetical protein HW35_08480 [Bacillus sp. X1(2014)]
MKNFVFLLPFLLLVACSNQTPTLSKEDEIRIGQETKQELKEAEEKAKKEVEEMLSWHDHEKYDFIAYQLLSRTEEERNGKLEYK